MQISSASIDAYNIKFTNVCTPTTDKDATSKKYFDDNLFLKQKKITAVTNITISYDVISANC